jgi:hypothetical protein
MKSWARAVQTQHAVRATAVVREYGIFMAPWIAARTLRQAFANSLNGGSANSPRGIFESDGANFCGAPAKDTRAASEPKAKGM